MVFRSQGSSRPLSPCGDGLQAVVQANHTAKRVSVTETINLHGLSLAEAKSRLSEGLEAARGHGESVVRIIHGQGKHSERFPVIKSYVRRWLEESDSARLQIQAVYPGEDGSPYTRPNAGETVVILRTEGKERGLPIAPRIEDEQEAFEARKHAKGMRADRLRTMRRRGPR